MYMVPPQTVVLISVTVIFYLLSKVLFDQVFETIKIVIDEEFHLPIGEAYCNFDFQQWHPKLTTLPGLYLISALVLGPFQLCSTYWLRFVSLLGATVNLILFYYIMRLINPRMIWWRTIWSSVNLALLPPLYFFSHVYYTDTVSLTSVLLMLITWLKSRHLETGVFAIMSVLMRQTNIIWIGQLFLQYTLIEFRTRKGKTMSLNHICNVLKNRQKVLLFSQNSVPYLTVFGLFVLFIWWNNWAIVVGDKTAHQPTINLPQIFYFSLFCMLWLWPYFLLTHFWHFLRFIRRNLCIAIIINALFLLIIYGNTVVHPYLLADNRHFVFYLWSRIYSVSLFRYGLSLVYLYSLFCIIQILGGRENLPYQSIFIMCTVVVLITQKLFEFRYFFVPFVLLRLQLTKCNRLQLILESITVILGNFLAFYIFFHKTIHWSDYDYPQRMIW